MKEMRNIFLGDIHGNLGLIHQYVNLYKLNNVNIIQVGDFGLGFTTFKKDKRFLELYHQRLVNNNVFVYAIRGNHDYKPYFDEDPFNLTNIKLVKDYTVLNLAGKNILFVGGAISIDRKMRTDIDEVNIKTIPDGYIQWWKDEVFVLDIDKLKPLRNIDIVVTHSAPTYCNPFTINGLGPYVESMIKKTSDFELKTDVLYERYQIKEMFDILKLENNIEKHFYGHFHQNAELKIDGTRHILLGVGELWEDRTDYYKDLD